MSDCIHTNNEVVMALGGATTSGVSGSSSSVCDVHSMSLALLVPDSSIPAAAASPASPASLPPVVLP